MGANRRAVRETIRLLRDGSCSDEVLAEVLVRLSAAKAEAERNASDAHAISREQEDSVIAANLEVAALEERIATAERERDEARAALAQARADALEEAAKVLDARQADQLAQRNQGSQRDTFQWPFVHAHAASQLQASAASIRALKTTHTPKKG